MRGVFTRGPRHLDRVRPPGHGAHRLERLPATLLLGGTRAAAQLHPRALARACGRRCVAAVARTAGSRRCRSRGTRRPRSGWAWCWRGWSGSDWRLLPAAGMQDPLLAPDAPWPARMADVAAHLVLPALTLSIVSIAGTMRYQRSAHARGAPPSLYSDRPGEGAARARGDLAARVAQRAVPCHHPVRSVAADAGDRLGVRRDRCSPGRGSARSRRAPPSAAGTTRCSWAPRCSSRRLVVAAACSPTSPTPCSIRGSATREPAAATRCAAGLARPSWPGGSARSSLAVTLARPARSCTSCPIRWPSPTCSTCRDLRPSLEHPFGTDQLSRDVLARVVTGAPDLARRWPLLAVALSVTLGAAVGLVAGYLGRRGGRRAHAAGGRARSRFRGCSCCCWCSRSGSGCRSSL